VVIAPPAEGPLPTNYTVTLTPVDGGSPITVICSTPSNCPVPGLTPDTTYLVRACAGAAGGGGACPKPEDGCVAASATDCLCRPLPCCCCRSPPRATTPTAPAPRPRRPAW
jgi:hypothetical protein